MGTPDTRETAGERWRERLRGFATALGLSPAATSEEVVAAIKSLKASEHETKAAQLAASTRLVEIAVAQRLLPYTRREWGLGIATRDPIGFAELLQNTTPAPSFEQQITDAAAEKVAASAGRLDLRLAIEQVQAEHPDLIQAYRAENRAKMRAQIRPTRTALRRN